MELLKILKYPDNRLRKIAKPVKKINKNIKNIIKNMFYIMYQNKGIGLAATQINIHLKIITIDIMEKNNPLVLINPKKIKENKTIIMEEGCLSIPKFKKKIVRSKNIEVEALNYYGKKIRFQASSLLSVCIQHEMDHLLGKLIIDY